ncbi:merozoite surface protein 7 [Plasmodium gonderi]|uniref:Merozoite surface protein 7 n=1 Tax=Plasmodium gonderi TaxID=77519 RepID=A0A1Y1JP90_PLAGO|nr:merozoite surface protein 7 [Plasmodium gonderi]GAW82223.1 merozoite surface protein 7 [Plasmodium gonderi]
MKKRIIFFGSIFVLLSCTPVSSEKIGPQKKKKNLEEDAAHMLMKKLEKLYKLNETNNGEIFNKEIESLKKQIEALQHGKANNFEGNIGQLLENESKDEFGQKTIFGMDEDDLDNYDADFIGQGKDITQGEENPENEDEENGEDENEEKVKGEDENDDGETANEQEVIANSYELGDEFGGGGDSDRPLYSSSYTRTSGQANPPSSQTPSQSSSSAATSEVNPAQGTPQDGSSPNANSATQSSNGQKVNVKYLDKLYDDVLKTDEKNQIHVPEYHSKYNEFRKNYEFTMNEHEYDIVKNLFSACFPKNGTQNAACAPVELFKKVLNNPSFQKEFDNFMHGLYGFAKRHNYLRGDKKDSNISTNLFTNIINMLNTIDVA